LPKSSREKSEETRSRVIEAAYSLFLEQGYHATSMREISQRANLTVGAIYNHFPAKEDLWKEILRARHPFYEIFPKILNAQGDTYAAMIRNAARDMVQSLRARPDLLNLILIEVVEFKAAHVPILFELFLPEVSRLQETFAGKTGKTRNIPAPVLMRSFVGLFFSYYVTGTLLNSLGGVTFDPQSLDQFVDLYLYGILSDDDPTRCCQPDPATASSPNS